MFRPGNTTAARPPVRAGERLPARPAGPLARVGAVTTTDLSAAVAATADRLARRRTGVVVGAVAGAAEAVTGRGDTGRGEAPGASSLFEIGSITKVFTALLLADGVVRGDWRLDTPVRDLLPAGAVVPDRDGVAITLEHLATHRSGLPRSPAGTREVLAGTVAMMRGRDPYAGLGVEQFHAWLATTRLRRVPGTGKPAYSNAGFGLLGNALAHAAGATYAELVRDRVCRPLELADTVMTGTATPDHDARTVLGHRGRGKAADPWPLPGIPGAGALRSTVTDMLRFVRTQLDPAGSPLEEAIRLTQQPHGDGSTGLGWQRPTKPGLMLWHNGGTGGFRSFAGLLPSSGAGVVVLANQARMVDLGAISLLKRLA